jgi:hypothetical protein
MTDIFFGLFGHHPNWVKALLIARNRIVSNFGLDVPEDAEILRPTQRDTYEVGDKIGPWPIFSMTEHELVVGRDNKHLDFRLSLLREPGISGSMIVVSTICDVHNLFGKIYLAIIAPFHKWGVKHIISAAVQAHRL